MARLVTVADREAALGQRGGVVWLTGLSGAGKSTIAFRLEGRLTELGHHSFVLDGDDLRRGLCADLGFSAADRVENIRRVGRVATLLADAGLIAICAFISPYHAGRREASRAVGADRFIEVYLDVSVEVCERRDPKGLYAKARRGEILDFTGIDAPYEPPLSATLVLDTDNRTILECVDSILKTLRDRAWVA